MNLRNQFAPLLLVISLAASSGCAALSNPQPELEASSPTTTSSSQNMLHPPESDCQIRVWYNYQVVAIPVINNRWISVGMSAEERAKRAFEFRHRARINARYMMEDQAAVKLLQARDLAKYGNPDGPTFEYLVDKLVAKGATKAQAYDKIIASSATTDNSYNEACK